MTHAARVGDDWNARILTDKPDESLATARDNEVDRARLVQQIAHRLPIAGRQHLDRICGQTGTLDRIADDRENGGIRPRRVRAAAKDHRVAGLQAQRARVGRHVGARLVDDGNHSDRHAHASNQETIRARRLEEHLAHRVVERGDFFHGVGHLEYATLIECEAIDQGFGRSSRARIDHVSRVRADDLALARPQPVGHRTQCGVFCSPIERGELARSGTRPTAHGDDFGHLAQA